MLLSHSELSALVARGVITNVVDDQINSASIDISLGPKLLVETYKPQSMESRHYIRLREREPLNVREMVPDDNGVFWLLPGQFVLAQSEQVFNLPNNISAEYKLKSSMARIGLEHLNAGWCDAGWHGSVLTLELKNMTNHHVIGLRPGDRIGQVVFFAHEPVLPEHSYSARGRYNNDDTVKGIKP